MLPPDSLQAFVLAAELGSFSAAARRLGKAQSAVSTAIANLEIDTGLQLFDRSARSPVLTRAGQSMLPYAQSVLLGHREILAKAASMAEGQESSLCLAVEQGLHLAPLLTLLESFSSAFAQVSLELLSVGPNEAAGLLTQGRADLGLMTERESYPEGFQFRGVGHTVLVPVCAANHPLTALDRVSSRDLRQHRQLLLRNRLARPQDQIGKAFGAMLWHAETPQMITELVMRGLGWAELPLPAVQPQIASGQLVRLHYSFQQSDLLAGIDVVWTERRVLGQAGQWLQTQLLNLPQDAWRS